jgi:hypothetical protein
MKKVFAALSAMSASLERGTGHQGRSHRKEHTDNP